MGQNPQKWLHNFQIIPSCLWQVKNFFCVTYDDFVWKIYSHRFVILSTSKFWQVKSRKNYNNCNNFTIYKILRHFEAELRFRLIIFKNYSSDFEVNQQLNKNSFHVRERLYITSNYARSQDFSRGKISSVEFSKTVETLAILKLSSKNLKRGKGFASPFGCAPDRNAVFGFCPPFYVTPGNKKF